MPTPRLAQVMALLTQFKSYVQTTCGITELGVFSSVARGAATEHSDSDLLIKAESLTVPDYLGLCDYFEKILNVPVDVLRRSAIRPLTWHYIQPDVRYV